MESQSRAQGCLQRRGHRGYGAARSAAGLLPRCDCPWDAGGAGALDPHAQARGPHAPTLEERRALRSDAADDASALELVPEAAVGAFRSPTAPGTRTRVRRAVSIILVRPASSHAEALA